MEQLIDSEMVQKIEKVLQEVELLPVSKIVSCTKMPSELQGYLSQSMKIKCDWVAEDNTRYVKHLYLKCYDESKEAHRAMRLKDSHFNEVYYYRQLQHRLGNFGPRCFYADEKDIMVEDLTYDGYQVNPVSQMLNYQQMKAALKRSAEFHAASLKWKLSNKEEFEYCLKPLREIAYPNDGRWSLGRLLKYGLSFALEVLKQNDSENHRAYRLLNKYQRNIDEFMTELLQPRCNKYDLLTHGDMWKNNILFKRINSDEFDVKLIDFQIIRHASVALDILYLTYSSADLDVLNSEQYDDLIMYYHSQLIQNLPNKENVVDLNIDWLKNELKEHALYGLIYSFMTVHVSCDDNENSSKLTNHNDKTNKGSQISPTYVEEIEAAMTKIPHNSIKTKRVLTVIKHFIDHFTATEK